MYICTTMKRIIPALLTLLAVFAATARETYNFNRGWTLAVGDYAGSETSDYDDSSWKRVTLPRAFNQEEAFRLRIDDLTDTVAWYRKHFYLPPHAAGKKIFVEFEGVRQGADVYLNGHHLGLHENGVMAFGFDLTPYINFEGEPRSLYSSRQLFMIHARIILFASSRLHAAS